MSLLWIVSASPEHPSCQGAGKRHCRAGKINRRRIDMQAGPDRSLRVQYADGKNIEHIDPRQVKHKEQQVEEPQPYRRVKLPGLVQAARHIVKQHRADINHQDCQESPVQADRKVQGCPWVQALGCPWGQESEHPSEQESAHPLEQESGTPSA